MQPFFPYYTHMIVIRADFLSWKIHLGGSRRILGKSLSFINDLSKYPGYIDRYLWICNQFSKFWPLMIAERPKISEEYWKCWKIKWGVKCSVLSLFFKRSENISIDIFGHICSAFIFYSQKSSGCQINYLFMFLF